MKINELAKLSGLNSETIRKYRERGLLKPVRNPENGYYEYSWPDFLNLLYIRKLRGASLSLDAIEATCRSGDAESLLQDYRKTITDLEKQIRELKRREMMLSITARHYERDAQATDQIRVIEAFDTKYDSYFDQTRPDAVRRRWIENVDLFTLVVCIEQRYFEDAALPERVPIRIGIGTYENIIREEHVRMPKQVSVFPKAKYASFFLEVADDLRSVPAERLEPIRQFLREKDLHALGNSTAYLYRVDTSGTQPRFIFCVRVMVEPLP